MSTTPVTDVLPGDLFTYEHSTGAHEVEVLKPAEPHTDQFGREMVRLWCRTGSREGWMIFGPSITLEVNR